MSSGSHKASARRQARNKPKSRRSLRRQHHGASHKASPNADWTRVFSSPEFSQLLSEFRMDSLPQLKSLASEFLDVVFNALSSSLLSVLTSETLDSIQNEADDGPFAELAAQIRPLIPEASDPHKVQVFRTRFSEKMSEVAVELKAQLLDWISCDSHVPASECSGSVRQIPGFVQIIRSGLCAPERFSVSQIADVVQELGCMFFQDTVQAYVTDIPKLEDALKDDVRFQEDPELLAFIRELESPDFEDSEAADTGIDADLLANALESLLDDID